MKKFFLHFILLFLAFQFIDVTFAQDTETIWRDVTESIGKDEIESFTSPNSFRVFELSVIELKKILDRAPLESSTPDIATQPLLSLPLPDGTFRIFRIMESPIMAPELSAKYPEIKTYIGLGMDDKSISCRIDITPSGFHSIMFTSSGTIYIDPKGAGSNLRYVSYFQRALLWSPSRGNFPEPCGYKSDQVKKKSDHVMIGRNEALTIGPELRTYRAAVAATGEYTQFHGGTVPLGLAAIVTAMNRVNGIYEREVAIRMLLVANNNAIIYTNPNTDPYTNNDGGTMLGENQTNIDNVIGSGNYDIGHVFSTGGGGIAGLSVVCSNYFKARGVTGSPTPIGDAFWVDYVAHEIGHQFSANHTFNGNAGACGGSNRYWATAFEPGSGSTIMAYAGICEIQDLQPHGDDYFHLISIQEIESYSQYYMGNNCPVVTQTGNAPPVVSPISGNYTIPISTPFALTGSASDPNGDPLTYCWEEWDLGPAGHPDLPTGDAPVFRSFLPTASPTRIFPRLDDLLNNIHTIGELLPTYSRTLHFRLTALDNRAGGGGSAYASTAIDVTASAGPFVVTYPNTAVTWMAQSTQTVTWDVSNTTIAPVNCTQVNILLSTDGGYTFPITIIASTPNDGSENITVPLVATTAARVKVEAVGNVFFDISNSNFTITRDLQVTVDQKLEGSQNSFGEFGRWESGPNFALYSAPHTFSFLIGNTEVLRGEQAILSAQKYYNWNSVTDNVINHRGLTIDVGTNTFVSNFKPTNSDVTIKTDLIELSGTTGGNVQFRDPWYIDFPDPSYNSNIRNRGMTDAVWYNRTSPFVPNYTTEYDVGKKYKGVFLNQDYNIPGNSYYSVGAPSPQTILNFSPWYFIDWSGTDVSFKDPLNQQTDVVFQSSNAIAKANFKAHRISNKNNDPNVSISPVSPNSQRKVDIVFSQNGVQYTSGLYQCVYEASGSVWFIESTDMGVTWTAEKRVSSVTGTAKYPSIVSGTNGAYISYIEQNLMGQWFVKFKKYSAGQWLDISPTANDTHEEDAPVAIINDDENTLFLVWEGLVSPLQYSGYWDDDELARGVIPYSGGYGKAVKPTLSHNYSDHYIAWRVGTIVYFEEVAIVYNPGHGLNLSFTQYRIISNTWQVAIGAPSITVDSYYHPAVSWTSEEFGRTEQFISFRQRISGNWGTFATIITGGNGDYWAPSVGGRALLLQQNSLRIAHNWGHGYNPIVVQRLENGYWLVPGCNQNLEGLHPNLVAITTGDFMRSVYPKASSIFPAGFSEITFTSDCLPKSSGTLESARELILMKDTTRVSLRLCEVKLKVGSDEAPLDWNTGYDTLVVGLTKEVHDYLRTANFTVPQNAHLKYRITNFKKGFHILSDSMYLRLQLVDANTNQVISSVGHVHPRTLQQGKQDNSLTYSLHNVAGQAIYMRIVLENIDPDVELIAIDTYLAPGGSFPKENGREGSGLVETPASYTLSQNYPNPFGAATLASNPTTEIAYSLPEGSDVKLNVIDALGREVAVLVNEFKEPGMYTAKFNGGKHPSGIYYYRLVAGKTTLTRKMSLVK